MFRPGGPSDMSTGGGDAAIRQTDGDAAGARLSASQRGYFSDPFISHLVPRARLQPPRPPLINVGTYVRGEGIDRLVEAWIALSRAREGGKVQIVSLGAGSDTRFWRIATGPLRESLAAYVEVDLMENTMKKAMAIRKSRDLSAVLGPAESVQLADGGTTLHSPVYHLVPADLRQDPSSTLSALFPSADGASPGLLSNVVPTLLLFECVLCYMQPSASQQLVQWFADAYKGHAPLGGIVYEMFGLEDSFGRVMRDNLRSRNVSLPGADPYPTLGSLPTRFLQHGFTTSRALTLRQIRKDYISPAELRRISALEMLDEVEELDLVLEHYAITWGVLAPEPERGQGWEEWGLAKPQISEEESD